MGDLVRVPDYVKVEVNIPPFSDEPDYCLCWQCVEMIALTQDEAQTVIDMLVDIDTKDKRIAELENPWISVDERLPKKNGHYLATFDNEVSVLYFLTLTDRWWRDKEEFHEGRVTHWMPIPERKK